MERPTTPQPKALVIFDDEESGKVWGFTLKQTGLDVVLADTSSDFLDIWANELPDLILLEDFDAESQELEICRILRRESPVPILLLTNKYDENHQMEAYKAGVDECIVQPVSPRLFMYKVRAWMRHVKSLPVSAVDTVNLNGFRLDTSRRQLKLPDGKSFKLTNLEARFLYVLMSNPGRVIDSGILVERIWGSFSGGDSGLLKNIVYRLRKKIEPDPANPCYLLTEGNQGYLFQGREFPELVN